MVCSVSCSISLIFIIGMIYFYNMTSKSNIVQKYKNTLSPELKLRYEKISQERMRISYYGYALGLLISLFIIFYNRNLKGKKLGYTSMICIVVATCFITNYFYYTLSPKSDWMLKHVKDKAQVEAWLQMYRGMQFYYHAGLVLGIIAVGILAYAFHC